MSKCQCSRDFPEEPFAMLSGEKRRERERDSRASSRALVCFGRRAHSALCREKDRERETYREKERERAREIEKERKKESRATRAMDGALTLQKGALRARCAERKIEKETLKENERERERERKKRKEKKRKERKKERKKEIKKLRAGRARALWTARSCSRKARPERAAQRERQKKKH